MRAKNTGSDVEPERSQDPILASFYGQQAVKRLRWIAEADYTNQLNRELLPSWQMAAVRLAITAAHCGRGRGRAARAVQS